MRFDSARSMVFQAYRVVGNSVMAGAIEQAQLGADVQRSRRQGNDWAIVHGLEAGAVISAVESLPMHLQAMCRYCWGPFTRDELAEDAEWLHVALCRAMTGQRLPGQGDNQYPPTKAWHTLTALAWAAIYHHGEVTYPYNRQGLVGPRAIKRWLEDERGTTIDVRRWNATARLSWSDTWRQLTTILDQWEAQALAPVAELIPRAA
ncbi:hypothetical protein RSO41_13430 [Halomonas sp. I1]|uniref:hypothetical protein n=1 Tax=Halomonas sp. I1 TaxID=393536 RepID=UPI0028DED2C4|nr:hypothetical protein [Halomonas sp. I1]MDT8895653.1 hypothetical protein [Halomonas sp. I1]